MNVSQVESGNNADTSSVKMVAVMGAIGLIASILLVSTYRVTLPYVEANRAAYLEQAIFEVLPGADSKMTFTRKDNDELVLLEDEKAKVEKFYAGYDKAGQLVGVAIEAQGQGFQDVLRLLYGYVPECECIVGMKVLESKETPGLGDKIEKDEDFRSNFDSLDVELESDRTRLRNEILMVKEGTPRSPWEITAITGATVSSKAVTNILNTSAKEVIPLIDKNLEALRKAATEVEVTQTSVKDF